MRFEIPECIRCCACVPVRHGILIFGYLNLGFTFFLLGIEIWQCVLYERTNNLVEILHSTGTYMFRGVGMFTQMWFILIIYGLETIFIVVLLFGAHKKLPRLIRVYYYYGITSSLAAFVSFFAVRPHAWGDLHFQYHIMEVCFAFSGLVLQVYLLLLIRSELMKLDFKTRLCFVNHASEIYVDPTCSEQGRNPL